MLVKMFNIQCAMFNVQLPLELREVVKSPLGDLGAELNPINFSKLAQVEYRTDEQGIMNNEVIMNFEIRYSLFICSIFIISFLQLSFSDLRVLQAKDLFSFAFPHFRL